MALTHKTFDFSILNKVQTSARPLALIEHASQGPPIHTTILLQASIYQGFIISAAGLIMAAWNIYSYFAHSALPGWTSLTALTLVFSGFMLVTVGIAGLYVGQIFEQIKSRPLFLYAEDTRLQLTMKN